MSEPGVVNKSAILMDEKVGGKYVIFHRVYPNILIDFRDHLDFSSDDEWLEGHHKIGPRPHYWDSHKLSVASAPMRIDEGWLTVYHAVGKKEKNKYKIGIKILDENDPTKVLYRSNEPILEPETHYENYGHKYGILYPGGAVIKDDQLFVYYGGSDKYTCVATAPLRKFVKKLINQGNPKLNTIGLVS
jgi:predicted GH43/DUF377 family glycosyl hydrolase